MNQNDNKNLNYNLSIQLTQFCPLVISLLFFIAINTHLIAQTSKKEIVTNAVVDKRLVENRFPTNVAPVNDIIKWFY